MQSARPHHHRSVSLPTSLPSRMHLLNLSEPKLEKPFYPDIHMPPVISHRSNNPIRPQPHPVLQRHSSGSYTAYQPTAHSPLSSGIWTPSVSEVLYTPCSLDVDIEDLGNQTHRPGRCVPDDDGQRQGDACKQCRERGRGTEVKTVI